MAHMNKMVMKQNSVESLVTFVFTQHLKAHDHTKFNVNSPWYSLWMSFKGPHNFMVTALGHSVKWLLDLYFSSIMLLSFVISSSFQSTKPSEVSALTHTPALETIVRRSEVEVKFNNFQLEKHLGRKTLFE